MKRMFKIGWLVLIIGVVALLVGYLNHGNQTVDFINGRPQVQRQRSWQMTNKHFDKIDLDVLTTGVTIERGDSFSVNYRGMQRNKPTVSVKDHVLTVKQQTSGNGIFNMGGFTDELVVTVPRDTQISAGTIKMGSGGLDVDRVDLTDTKIDIASGAVSLNNLTLNGGQTKLQSGEFEARGLRINGHYRVENDSGDNDVYVAKLDGYRLETTSGENAVNGQDKDDQTTIEENMAGTNTLELITNSGDNEYHQR